LAGSSRDGHGLLPVDESPARSQETLMLTGQLRLADPYALLEGQASRPRLQRDEAVAVPPAASAISNS
jgi:hypothetical protein